MKVSPCPHPLFLREGREGREGRGGRGEREGKEGREGRNGKEAEFNTQEKKGPHCGPRFSYENKIFTFFRIFVDVKYFFPLDICICNGSRLYIKFMTLLSGLDPEEN